MFDMLFQSICRAGIFMICAQAIVHFKPKESYEKYLKLLVSVMILIQVFLPIGSLLAKGGREGALMRLEAFRESLEEGLRAAEEQAEETDKILERMTLKEIQKRVEEQAALQADGMGEEKRENGGTGGEEGEAGGTGAGAAETGTGRRGGSETEPVTTAVDPIEAVEPVRVQVE